MYDVGGNRFLLGDCFERMAEIATGSVDMVLADLPYGTTACAWDSVLPFDRLWAEYWRVCKPGAAVVLTASQPFTSALVMSQVQHFKYSWVWDKIAITGFANAKRQPLRHLEDVLVFYKRTPTYNPQGLRVANISRKNTASDGGGTLRGDVLGTANRGALRTAGVERVQEATGYPRQLLVIGRDRSKIHPTQKPVALFEYLIRTYTEPGALVLDNTAGSGTTAIAALNTGRRFVCIERDEGYYWSAVARVCDWRPA